MFKKREHTVVEFSPEDREALGKLDADTTTLCELMREVVDNQRALMDRLSIPARENGHAEVGVEVFANAEGPDEAFATMETEPGENMGIRESPFGRAPRKVQVAWLRDVMADGMWHSAFEVADRYATDERHRRYMRGAVSGRLREMYEDGEVERRDSPVRGSMYEYRLKPKAAKK